MTNYQAPNNTPNPGTGCAKVFGYGCLSIVGLLWLGASSIFGGGGGSLTTLLIFGGIVALIIWSKKRNRRDAEALAEKRRVNDIAFAERQAAHAQQEAAYRTSEPKVHLEPPRVTPAAATSATGGEFDNPLCDHTFTAAQISAGGTLTCTCGYNFSSADLKEFRRLSQTLVKTYESLEALEARMTAAASKPVAMAAATTVAAKPINQPAAVAAPAAAPVAPPKPVKPKVEKPKRDMTLAQWLIIGSSVLVLIAGSVFVSQYMYQIVQEGWMAIVAVLGIATGFGAFKVRNFSVMLANFLAAFSSAMQLAMMSMIADQTTTEFTWQSMPPTWWAISLFAVSAGATILAKFSKNFAWKGIALASFAAAAITLVVGVDSIRLSAGFGLQFSLLLLTAVASLAQVRFLVNLPRIPVKDKALEAYEKDLAEREVKSLSLVGRLSAGLQIFAALGLVLMGAFDTAQLHENPLTLLLLAAVWVPLGYTKKFWIDQISTDEAVLAKLDKVASAISYFAILLAGFSLTTTLQVTNALVSAIIFMVLPLAALWISPLFKNYAPTQLIQQIGLWLAAAVWLVTGGIANLQTPDGWNVAVSLLLFSLLFSVADLKLGRRRNTWVSFAVHTLGLFALYSWCLGYVPVLDGSSISFGFVLLILAFVLLAQAGSAIQRFVNRRLKVETKSILDWAGFAIAAGFLYVLVGGVGVTGDVGPSQHYGLIAVFTAYALATQSLATWGPLKKHHSKILQAHGYLGQSVTLLSILMISSALGGANYLSSYALLIAMLAVINYAFGAVAKSALRMQLGFGAALIAFFVQQAASPLATLPAAVSLQVGVVAGASWLHSFLLRKRSSASTTVLSYTPVISVFASLGLTAIVAAPLLESATTNDIYILDAVLAILAIAATVVSELKSSAKLPTRVTALRWIAMIYAGWTVFASAINNPYTVLNAAEWRLLPALVILSAVMMRLNAKRGSGALLVASYANNLFIAGVAGVITWNSLRRYDLEIMALWLSAALIVTTLIAGKQVGKARRLLMLDIPILGTAISSLIYSAFGVDFFEWRRILAFALIAAYAYLRSGKGSPQLWLTIGYLSGGFASASLGDSMLMWGNIQVARTELVDLLIAGSILVGNLFFVRRLGDKLQDLRLSAVVSVLTLPSLWAGYMYVNQIEGDGWSYGRRIGALLIITAFSLWRISRSNPVVWSVLSYSASILTAIEAGRLFSVNLLPNYGGPEFYSVLVGGAVLLTHRFALKRFELKGNLLAWGLPLAVISLPSLFYSFSSPELAENHLRRILALAVIAGYSIWNLTKTKKLAWILSGYASALLTGASTAWMIQSTVATGYQGPEIYGALLAGAVLLVHRFALQHLSFKRTLFSWGLPIGLALVPSTLYTYTALTTPFESLDGLQITRVVVVLLASIVLLVLGMRRGNLAMATMGVVGLGLMIVPNTAMRGGELSVETTSLVLGALLFTLLSLFKQAGKLGGNSMLFIGLPISLFLAPSLVTSLMALGHAEAMTSVDWWRFGIVLTAGLTLLIVGALRELGGMFYPGLATVLLAALPYGFTPIGNGAWFMWVLLLLVAAVMIWIALRLEKLRKQGKGSSEWFRELK